VPCSVVEVAAADLVVVRTDHDELDWELIAQHSDHVLDTRNRLAGGAVERL
jgi:UDP-N-acetyl-D-glucosamine dehydrogenase